jgi:hypothetical protein
MNISSLHPPLQESDLIKIEEALGYPLPLQYRDFIKQYNGGRPTPHRFSTVDEKIESGVKYFFSNSNEAANLLSEINEFTLDGIIPRNLFPIAITPAENRLLLSGAGEDVGCVYYWSWDEEPEVETCSYKYMRKVANSFNDFLSKLRP